MCYNIRESLAKPWKFASILAWRFSQEYTYFGLSMEYQANVLPLAAMTKDLTRTMPFPHANVDAAKEAYQKPGGAAHRRPAHRRGGTWEVGGAQEGSWPPLGLGTADGVNLAL
jgi:hypothetical protein